VFRAQLKSSMPGMKWKTLEHNGILFSPHYESKGIKIAIRGKPVDLDILQEEFDAGHEMEDT
jgi:hypothetical protein